MNTTRMPRNTQLTFGSGPGPALPLWAPASYAGWNDIFGSTDARR
ncbi:MAG: hypothetical protein ABI607_01825 [Betaproteobacteria bacterium]